MERKAPNRDRPPTAGSVGSVVNPAPEHENRTQSEQGLSTAFHALRAAANEKRANDPKRQKSGTMSGFIIGSGRIGPGAAPKRQNPHEPPTTRSRRDSTRILTSARYSCLVRQLLPPSKKSEQGGALEHGTDLTQKHETHLWPELLRAQRRVRDDYKVEV